MEDKVKRCNIHLIRVPEEIIENRRRNIKELLAETFPGHKQ